MLRALSAVVLFVASAQISSAQLYQVSLAEGGGISSCGSGTAISPNCIVTNSHVVDHNAGLGHQVRVSGDGINCTGKVIAIHNDIDLAIVRTTSQLSRIASLGSTPRVGQPVTFAGITSGIVKTQVIPSDVYLDQNFQIPVVELQCPAVPGDSGGGIFDNSGRLVAINWGSANSHAHAVSVDCLNQWMPAIEANCGPLGCSREARQVFVRPPNYQIAQAAPEIPQAQAPTCQPTPALPSVLALPPSPLQAPIFESNPRIILQTPDAMIVVFAR